MYDLPPVEFENWATIALGGRKNQAQVGDKGKDGRIFPVPGLPVQDAARENAVSEQQRRDCGIFVACI
ncbi:MAG: hypothetical protein WCK55_18170 [Verrucomicrobiota bacterium]